MKKTITAILAIAFMVLPTNAMAQIETWAEYDKRLEKDIADTKAILPMGEEDDDIILSDIEKRGKVIITTLESKGEISWIKLAESMGGVEKFKAMMQRQHAETDLMLRGVTLARGYTLRYRYIDKGKEVCTVDVSKKIIISMIKDDSPEYIVEPLPGELFKKSIEYEKYLKDGGYPPALTTEELHLIREFRRYCEEDLYEPYMAIEELHPIREIEKYREKETK